MGQDMPGSWGAPQCPCPYKGCQESNTRYSVTLSQSRRRQSQAWAGEEGTVGLEGGMNRPGWEAVATPTATGPSLPGVPSTQSHIPGHQG